MKNREIGKYRPEKTSFHSIQDDTGKPYQYRDQKQKLLVFFEIFRMKVSAIKSAVNMSHINTQDEDDPKISWNFMPFGKPKRIKKEES